MCVGTVAMANVCVRQCVQRNALPLFAAARVDVAVLRVDVRAMTSHNQCKCINVNNGSVRNNR